MADKMVDSMEKMKRTSEEEEIIEIFAKGRLEAIERCNLSLIGKFLTCKPFNKMATKNTMWRAWGVYDDLEISKVGLNLFQFKFQSEFEMDRILRGGLWSFDNQLLMLQRWKKGMTVGNIKMVTMSLWVQIWGAPFDMISPHVAKEVGGRLGVVEEVEWKKRKDDIFFFYASIEWTYQFRNPLGEVGLLLGQMESGIGWILSMRDYLFSAITVGY